MTAAESETLLQLLYTTLDAEKLAAIESVNQAVANYREQHASIVEVSESSFLSLSPPRPLTLTAFRPLKAIVVFAGRIHQHAGDYLQREQLVAKAFAQYLSSIVNGLPAAQPSPSPSP